MDASPAERVKHAPQQIQEDEDFLFAVTTRASARRMQSISRPVDNDQAVTDAQHGVSDNSADISEELTPETDLYEDTDDERRTRDARNAELDVTPTIVAADYEDDEEFKYMFKYIRTGELTGDDKIDRTTLLLRDQFVCENDVLYRIEIPRKKHLASLIPLRKRLCIPTKFRLAIITFVHESCGHFALDNLFLSLSSRYYWKTLFKDTTDFCKTCDVCMKSKPNLAQRAVPLYPVTPPNYPGEIWSIDHKVLTRKTDAGNTAILVCVDNFSGWPFFIPVPNLSAEVTAYAFVQHVITMFGTPSRIHSDKSTSFMNLFFSKICSLLGIKHTTSASLMSKSNGQAEGMIRRLVALLKIYANDDITLEAQLPLIEFSIRASAQSRLQLSPFQVVFGRDMPINAPGETSLAMPFSGDKEVYYCWLAKEIKRLHAAVRERKMQIKKDDKQAYDKANKVQEPVWKVGDRVLIRDVRIKPHSKRVITNRPYHGPMRITEVVQKSPDIGKAYKVEREDGGKPLKFLVTADRLKLYDTDRTQLLKRLPQRTVEKTGNNDKS